MKTYFYRRIAVAGLKISGFSPFPPIDGEVAVVTHFTKEGYPTGRNVPLDDLYEESRERLLAEELQWLDPGDWKLPAD